MNIGRLVTLRKVHVLLAAGLIAAAGAGCDFISPGQAREAIEAGREMRQFEQETIRPLEAQLETLRMTEIEPRHREVEDLHSRMRQIEQEKLEPVRRSFEGYRQENDPQQQQMQAGFRRIDQAQRALDIEWRNLEAQSRADVAALDDERRGVIPAEEERKETLQRELNNLHRYGHNDIEDLRRQIESLRRELGSYPPESEEHAALVATISALDSDVSGREQTLKARTHSLENELWALEDRLQDLYRTYDRRMRSLQEATDSQKRSLEERRLALDEERWQLEDAARQHKETTEAQFRAREQGIRDQIAAIEEGEIRPLKERISAIETELRTLHERERALKEQVRAAWAEFEPKARQLEDQVLDMLESAVSSAEGTPASGR